MMTEAQLIELRKRFDANPDDKELQAEVYDVIQTALDLWKVARAVEGIEILRIFHARKPCFEHRSTCERLRRNLPDYNDRWCPACQYNTLAEEARKVDSEMSKALEVIR